MLPSATDERLDDDGPVEPVATIDENGDEVPPVPKPDWIPSTRRDLKAEAVSVEHILMHPPIQSPLPELSAS